MNKSEFLDKLGDRIHLLPEDDIQKSLEYYGEIIDDYIEDGVPENEAVARLGNMEEIVSQILSEVPLAKIVKKRVGGTKKPSNMMIVLLILGFPVWLPLLAAAFSVLLAAYVTLWAGVISLWACFGAMVGTAFGGTVGGIALVFIDSAPVGLSLLGASLVCAGLSILFFFVCRAASVGMCILTKKTLLGIKFCFVGKEKR